MGDKGVNSILIPGVNTVGPKKKAGQTALTPESRDEFKKLLQENITKVQGDHGLKLSMHAAQRLKERDMNLEGDEFIKIKNAIEKVRAKGGQDSLIITDKGAFIVDVKNNKIVTAIDKDSLNENVFTKIDSTVIV